MARRWNVIPRRWRAIAALGALLLLGAVLPISGASATSPVAFDAGYLRLHMNTDGSSFKYFNNSDQQVGGSQTFSAGTKCNYVAGSNGTLLMAPTASATVSGTVVGYLQKDNGYGLGVNKGGKEGTGSCTQTNLTEKLTLELQNDGSTSPVKGMYVSSTDLDMEFKYNASLNAHFYLNNADASTDTITCLASDCGPDSGGGDNYRVNLQAPVTAANPNGLWDKVELTVSSSSPQGAVTLEGGNDIGTSDSIFNLSQLLTPITCGETVPGSGGGTHVDVTLVDNGTCVDKGYTLDVTSRTINLNTASDTGTVDQWVLDVNAWSPEPAANPVPATIVFPPTAGEPAVFCDGTYDGLDDPATGGTFGASMPHGHSWCLIKQSTQIAGEVVVNNVSVPAMQVYETFLLEADALACRTCK